LLTKTNKSADTDYRPIIGAPLVLMCR